MCPLSCSRTVEGGRGLLQSHWCIAGHSYIKGAKFDEDMVFAGKLKHHTCFKHCISQTCHFWTAHHDANTPKDLSERSTEPNPGTGGKAPFANKSGVLQPMESWRCSGEPHLHISVAASPLNPASSLQTMVPLLSPSSSPDFGGVFLPFTLLQVIK